MIDNVFIQLNKRKIKYVVWKDTYRVDLFFMGDAELDLLVSEQYKNDFERIIHGDGFSKLKLDGFLRKDGIEHYIKFCNSKYYHLHVYYKILTGNHYVKEYCFDLDEGIFSRALEVNGIQVVNVNDEFSLLLMRRALKHSLFFSSFKNSEIKRANELVDLIDLNEVDSLLLKYMHGNNFCHSDAINFVTSNKLSLRKKYSLKRMFVFHKKTNPFQFYFHYFLIRMHLLFLRVKRASNKRMLNKGVSVGILGTDGSGKSTVAEKLLCMFRAKVSAKTIYLGGNSKTYSLSTRVFYFFYLMLRVFSPYKERLYVAWLLYCLGFNLLEYGKAKDRARRAERGVKLVQKGWVVIYERFPIVGLFDFPNHLMELGKDEWKIRFGGRLIVRLQNKIRTIVEGISRPDFIFLLTVDFDQIQSRRKLTVLEEMDIKRKLATQRKYLEKNELGIIQVSNSGKIDKVLSTIITMVNKKLCKYN